MNGRDGALTAEDVQSLRKQYAANPVYRLVRNALAEHPADTVALDRELAIGIDHTVSHTLDDWKVTDQGKSGRCWMFAGLNLLRVGAKQRMGLADFEFSQNYLMFWDKIESANHFLSAIIDTADRPVDDRTVAHLLGDIVDDGGQWDMFVALVRKHGLVPKSVMPETHSSNEPRRMNAVLRSLLRDGARALRESGGTVEELAVRKRDILTVVWRVLAIHLGTPPERFDWQWVDSDRQFHRDGELTPAEFAQRYVTLPLAEYVSLVHDPRPANPPGRTYTVAYLGNVVEAPPVVYLNVPMDVLKDIAATTVAGGEPVWFGCDVAKQFNKELGVWDANLLDYGALYGVEFGLDKAARLAYGETAMDHAMLFTGVDLADGVPRRWRVENSWGDELGQKGFFTMNDSWFGEYVFEIAARRDRLPADLRAALDTPPVVLPPWDPMGALAR